jgi:hypothetical protein
MVWDYLNDQIDELRCTKTICIFAWLEIKVKVMDSNQSNGEFSIKRKALNVPTFQVVSKARLLLSQNTNQSHPSIPLIPKVNIMDFVPCRTLHTNILACICEFWPPKWRIKRRNDRL